MILRSVKLILVVTAISLSLVSCKVPVKEDPEPAPIQKLYPVSVTRTASYTSDTLKSVYTYNPQNQITKEEIFKNRALQSINFFTYDASGKLTLKTYHDAAGLIKERDEISYNSNGYPDRLSHGYIDAANVYTPHHYRVHEFNADGEITKWTDFTPSGTVINSRTYNYPAGTEVISPFYSNAGQHLNTSEIAFDQNFHPFVNTSILLVTFAGNERRHEVKDLSGNLLSGYNNTFIYNEQGYPEKLLQVHFDGTLKTEEYRYKGE